jgi:hypothetical protein
MTTEPPNDICFAALTIREGASLFPASLGIAPPATRNAAYLGLAVGLPAQPLK